MKTRFRIYVSFLAGVFIFPICSLSQTLTWTGATSADWHAAMNWSPAQVPTAANGVLVPAGLVLYPVINGIAAECNDLELSGGAVLTISKDLSVHGNASISGLVVLSDFTDLILLGDIIWEAGSEAQAGSFSTIIPHANWTFGPGSQVNLTNGYVSFQGTADSWIVAHADCYFNTLQNLKSSPASLNLSHESTEEVKLHANLISGTGTILNIFSPELLIIHGAFSVFNSHLYCHDGDIVLRGNPGTDFTPLPGSFLHGLIVDIGPHTWDIWNTYTDTLCIKESISLQTGYVNLHYLTLTIGLNYVDTANNINTGTSMVVFNGSFPEQVIRGGHFDLLVLDKPGTGFINFVDGDVVVEQYDWVSGVFIVQDGVVSVNNLLDPALLGSWRILGGQLTLVNFDDGLDLQGDMEILDGELILISPADTVTWPSADDCNFIMVAGVLDIRSAAFYLDGSYNNFFHFISGGVIRVAGDFYGMNPGFHPDHGTIEFSLDGLSLIFSVPGFAFHDLTLSKCPADTVMAMNNMLVKGDFVLNSGHFAAPDTLEVMGDWTNYCLGQAFLHGNGKVIFSGPEDSYIWTKEGFYDLLVSKSLLDTARLFLTQDVDLHVYNDLLVQQGSFQLRLNTSLHIEGDVFIANLAGLQSFSTYANLISLKGNWLNANTMPANLYRGFLAPEVFILDGSADQSLFAASGSEYFNNFSLIKPSGKFRPLDNVCMNGNLLFVSGTWENAQDGLVHSMSGNANILAGAQWNGTVNPGYFVFTGPAFQTFSFNGSGCMPNIRVDKIIFEGSPDPYDGRVWLLSDLDCPAGSLVVNMGEMDLNGHSAGFGAGVVLFTTAASLEVDTGAVLRLGPTGFFSNGGKLRVCGQESDKATITRIGQAYYQFFTDFGEFFARHAIFEYMDTLGITLGTGTAVHPLHGFGHCTFRQGEAGGVLLRLSNQELLIQNAYFPENTWGSLHNATKLSPAGALNFIGYSGAFSGDAFELDPHDNINWLGPMLIQATANPQSITAGDSTQLGVTVFGGFGPFSFTWAPLSGLSAGNIQGPMAAPAATTTYHVTVSDVQGHVMTDSVTVVVTVVQGAAVAGNISYFSLAKGPLSGVKVMLFQNSVAVDSALTGASGDFSFPFVEAGLYGFRCFSQTPWGGVNATDALNILRHYVGMITLTGLLYEVADVNDNGYVNSLDALIAIRRYAGYISSFPTGDWAFNAPLTLLVETAPIALDINGLCYGDVNMSYQPPFKAGSHGIELDYHGEIHVNEGMELFLPICMKEAGQLAALSLDLLFPLHHLEILAVSMANGQAAISRLIGDTFRIAWYDTEALGLAAGDALLHIHCRVLDAVDIPGLQLLPGCEAAGPDALPLSRLKLGQPLIKPMGPPAPDACFLYPNPAREVICLNWGADFQDVSPLTVDIFNGMGLHVAAYSFEPAGKASIVIDLLQWRLAPGMYTCKLSAVNKGKPLERCLKLLIAR